MRHISNERYPNIQKDVLKGEDYKVACGVCYYILEVNKVPVFHYHGPCVLSLSPATPPLHKRVTPPCTTTYSFVFPFLISTTSLYLRQSNSLYIMAEVVFRDSNHFFSPTLKHSSHKVHDEFNQTPIRRTVPQASSPFLTSQR